MLSYKLIEKNSLRYILFFVGFISLFHVGCSSKNIENIDVNSIKEKTKDIKKVDLEELKEKIKKIKK